MLLLFLMGVVWGGLGVYCGATHVAKNGHDHSKNDIMKDWPVVILSAAFGPFYNLFYGN